MRREDGFTYVLVMFVVAVLAIISTRAMENSLTNARRDKEAELLYVGQAYWNAIKTYYDYSPGTSKEYPPDLTSLLQDNRTSTMRRPLRKLYRDPITGSDQWGLVLTEDGRIKGVYSLSQQAPIKKNGFLDQFAAFTVAKTYRDWQFVYQSQ
jgi:type II secretory pathway pseudopilin PulG